MTVQGWKTLFQFLAALLVGMVLWFVLGVLGIQVPAPF